MPELPVEKPGYVGSRMQEEGEECGWVVPWEADASFGGGSFMLRRIGSGGGEMARLSGRWRRRP